MDPKHYPLWIPNTLASIEGKPAAEQVEILLARLVKMATVMDEVNIHSFQNCTGDSYENCREILNF